MVDTGNGVVNYAVINIQGSDINSGQVSSPHLSFFCPLSVSEKIFRMSPKTYLRLIQLMSQFHRIKGESLEQSYFLIRIQLFKSECLPNCTID